MSDRRQQVRDTLRNPMNLKEEHGVILDRETYKYRWTTTNDDVEPRRVERFRRMGWEIVHNAPSGKTKKDDSKGIGPTAVVKTIGSTKGNDPKVAVLMRITKEMWRENQRIKYEIRQERYRQSTTDKVIKEGNGNVEVKGKYLDGDEMFNK